MTPDELAAAHAQLARLGPADQLPVTPPPGVTLTPAAYAAYKASAQFISPDGTDHPVPDVAAAGPLDQHRGRRRHPGRARRP